MPDQIIIKRAHRGGRGRDKKKRTMNPKSIANLKPATPGHTPNPKGNNRPRPYTEAYEVTADSVTPEFVRITLNMKLWSSFDSMLKFAQANNYPPAIIKAIQKQQRVEFIPKGMLWAKANALRMHMEAVMEANVAAATEVREAVEGRSTQRIEFPSSNSRLEQLLDEFRMARQNPPKKPGPESK